MEIERQYDEFRGKNRRAIREGGVSDVVCEVGKGSGDGDRGVRNEIEGRKSRPRSANRDYGVPMQRSSPSRVSSTES
jgi:hypothetical protein